MQNVIVQYRSKIFPINIDPRKTVQDFKKVIAESTKIKINNFGIKQNFRFLIDTKPVSFYINNGTSFSMENVIIKVMVNIEGNMSQFFVSEDIKISEFKEEIIKKTGHKEELHLYLNGKKLQDKKTVAEEEVENGSILLSSLEDLKLNMIDNDAISKEEVASEPQLTRVKKEIRKLPYTHRDSDPYINDLKIGISQSLSERGVNKNNRISLLSTAFSAEPSRGSLPSLHMTARRAAVIQYMPRDNFPNTSNYQTSTENVKRLNLSGSSSKNTPELQRFHQSNKDIDAIGKVEKPPSKVVEHDEKPLSSTPNESSKLSRLRIDVRKLVETHEGSDSCVKNANMDISQIVSVPPVRKNNRISLLSTAFSTEPSRESLSPHFNNLTLNSREVSKLGTRSDNPPASFRSTFKDDMICRDLPSISKSVTRQPPAVVPPMLRGESNNFSKQMRPATVIGDSLSGAMRERQEPYQPPKGSKINVERSVTVEYRQKTYEINVDPTKLVIELKRMVAALTAINIENFNLKNPLGILMDTRPLSLYLKGGTKFMLDNVTINVNVEIRGREIPFLVNENMTVSDFKVEVMKKTGEKMDMILSYKNKGLMDSRTIFESQIENGCTIVFADKSCPPKQTFNVKYRHRSYQVDMDPATPVIKLKEIISGLTGVEVDNFDLKLHMIFLDDHKPLSKYSKEGTDFSMGNVNINVYVKFNDKTFRLLVREDSTCSEFKENVMMKAGFKFKFALYIDNQNLEGSNTLSECEVMNNSTVVVVSLL